MYEAVAIDGMEVVQTAYLAGVIGHNVTPSFVRLALKKLAELNEIKFEAHPGQLQIIVERRAACLTPNGSRLVEIELRDADSLLSKYRDHGLDGLEDQLIVARGIPASDRIVLRSDNQSVADEAVSALTAVREELQSRSNEIGETLGDDRDLAIEEVQQLETMASRPRVRVEPLVSLARKTLGWIVEKAGLASVSDLAKKALALLIDWLNS